MTKISIIIPTLNEEKIIEKTLRSLREYNGDYEIIVSDGRSTDQTVEIARQYADKVEVYHGTARQTIAMGRNLGASVATGEYLLFLDADMYIPNINVFLPKAVAYFENSPRLVALTAYLKVFPEVANFGDIVVPFFFNRMVFAYNNIFHHGASQGEFQMMRASAFAQVNGFNERLIAGEDFDMFARLSKRGQTRSIPSLVVFHTSRRAHKVGWSKLLWSWFQNWFSATFLNKSYSAVWEEIR